MANVKSAWRRVLLSYPCPTCEAEPGEPCTSSTGRPYPECHADRARFGDRCPHCMTRLAADAMPGDLCPRCELVRSLEAERATTHHRLT